MIPIVRPDGLEHAQAAGHGGGGDVDLFAGLVVRHGDADSAGRLARARPGGQPRLAYLAHGEGPIAINGMFGEVFGTLYDLSTIIILSFAGLARSRVC